MRISSEFTSLSKSNLYWNPAQPPPNTVILKYFTLSFFKTLAICS